LLPLLLLLSWLKSTERVEPQENEMEPMFSVSKPVQAADGRWTVDLGFQIHEQPVVMTLYASDALGAKLENAVRSAGHSVAFGGANPYAEVWGYSDVPMAAAMEVAQDPEAQAAVVSFGAYSSPVADIGQAIHAYWTGQVHPMLVRDAQAGVPAAQMAVYRLNQVAAAHQLLTAVHQRAHAAIEHLRMLAQGMSQGDPMAIEAYMVMDGVHRVARGLSFLKAKVMKLAMEWTGSETPAQLAQKMMDAIHGAMAQYATAGASYGSSFGAAAPSPGATEAFALAVRAHQARA